MTSSTFIPNQIILLRLPSSGTKVVRNELSVTLPVADYAPKKLGELVGLLFHPKGWPGTKWKKYMPVSLVLE